MEGDSGVSTEREGGVPFVLGWEPGHTGEDSPVFRLDEYPEANY